MKYLALIAALTVIPALSACRDKRPNVILQTEMGPIEIEVYKDKAPASAADFLYYVDNGLYDNQGFYRVVREDNDPQEMGMAIIQGGRLDTLPLTASIAHERQQRQACPIAQGLWPSPAIRPAAVARLISSSMSATIPS